MSNEPHVETTEGSETLPLVQARPGTMPHIQTTEESLGDAAHELVLSTLEKIGQMKIALEEQGKVLAAAEMKIATQETVIVNLKAELAKLTDIAHS